MGALLVAHGAKLVDADAIVRELQSPGSPVLDKMAQHFGSSIIDAEGALDRLAVAEIVFNDADQLEALNKIVHPAVNREMTDRRRSWADTDETVILDIPLLIESGHTSMAGIIVVDTPVDIAVARLMAHRGFSEDDARARMKNQVSRDERKEKADFVVDNSGDFDALKVEVDRCWAWIATLERPEPGSWVEPTKGRYG